MHALQRLVELLFRYLNRHFGQRSETVLVVRTWHSRSHAD